MSLLMSSILSLMLSFERGIWDNLASAAFPSMIFAIFIPAGLMSGDQVSNFVRCSEDRFVDGYKAENRQSSLFI